MNAQRKRRTKYSLIAITIILPFIFLSSHLAPWQSRSPIATIWQEVIYGFEYLWSSTTGFVVQSWNHYVNLKDTAQENTELRSQLVQLKTKLLDYEEKVQETIRLRKLLGFSQTIERQYIIAEVVANLSGAPFELLRINRGTRHEVSVGMPVVTDEGIIGRILRTGLNYSDVQLVTDANFNIDVLLQRTRVRGVLRGVSGSSSILNLNKHSEIRIGDTIITSGIVGGFPKGLPIGRVRKISYESDDVAQTITVDPWVDFRRVEEVIILKETDKEIQKIAETAGDEWLVESVKKAAGG